jgi:hypothetical protein
MGIIKIRPSHSDYLQLVQLQYVLELQLSNSKKHTMQVHTYLVIERIVS